MSKKRTTKPTETTPAPTVEQETPVSATPTPAAPRLPKRLVRDAKAKEMSETSEFTKEFPSSYAFVRALQELVKAGKIEVAVADNGDCDCDAVLLERLMEEVRAYRAAHPRSEKPAKPEMKKKYHPSVDPFYGLNILVARAKRTIEMYEKLNKSVDFSNLKKILADVGEVPIRTQLKMATVSAVEAEKLAIEAEKSAHELVLQAVATRTRGTITKVCDETSLCGSTVADAKERVEKALADGLANLNDRNQVSAARNVILEVGTIFWNHLKTYRITGGRIDTSNRPRDEFRRKDNRTPRREDAKGTHGGQRYRD